MFKKIKVNIDQLSNPKEMFYYIKKGSIAGALQNKINKRIKTRNRQFNYIDKI
jgi:hypothetical protein